MMKLRDLVREAFPDHPGLPKIPEVPIRGLEVDSRKVEKDFVFIAVRGVKQNGNDYIEEAIRRGAAAVVTDSPKDIAEVPQVVVAEARSATAKIASVFYGNPSGTMKVIGITGTNGKTTTTYLLEHLLTHEGKKTGVLGTVSYRLGDEVVLAKETTPGPLQIQRFFTKMRDAACDYAVMEVSSHALDQRRVEGIDFQCALFTNLTQDHLDYHKSLDAYFRSKARLFLSLRKGKTAILNADDPWAMKLAGVLSSQLVTFGIEHAADFVARDIRFYTDCTQFVLETHGHRVAVNSPLVGRFNVYNVLGALAVMHALGFPLERSIDALDDFSGVPGRLERIPNNRRISVFVDFAHTPDGLFNVLRTLNEHKKKGLILVFGCGGERDRTKRPKMGQIAAQYADFVYVTSDNPRSEDPRTIAQEIVSGFPPEFGKYQIILDRAEAIRTAISAANEDDVVLLAGKGHEMVQVIGPESIPFSDREEVKKVLQ